jgi:glyoxylase-like metal-dependent hydrolase (beta-lactamase superfamily II)
VSALTKITEHVYWMAPGPPDRPSLCAVVGDRWTLMLDPGSSRAHTRTFLDALMVESGTRPSAVVYTHSHWDHVLGGAEVGGLVIAHALTAERLLELAARDWSDEAVKAELPAPRKVEVVPADVIFSDSLEIDLGGVKVDVRHVGGDHSADSTMMFVEPDRVLFLGDCMYASSQDVLTADSAFRLQDAILGFAAEHHVEGHHPSVSSRREMEDMFGKMRLAERAAREGSAIAAPDEDTEYFLRAFTTGRALT